jgi:hypothetical protein
VRLVASVESKNLLFLKKKKQKDFAGLRPRRAEQYRKQAEVFGSFFQKKNGCFLSFRHQPERATRPSSG